MKIKLFTVNPFLMNCYIYYDDKTLEGIIIDPGVSNEEEQTEIVNFVNVSKIKIVCIINTHGHIDHVMGNKWAKETFKVPVYIHKEDLNLIESVSVQGALFGLDVPQIPKPDKFISEEDIILFDHCKIKILHTPGHSSGSICLIDEVNKNIFCGDCIFKNSIGRTDLPGGDTDTLLNSINNKIFSYPDDFTIYPGHMEMTSLGDEKKFNPFLNGEYLR